MGKSNYVDIYAEKVEGEFYSDYIVLLNIVEMHNKQKYLLVIGQDLRSKKVFKFIDTHGIAYELYKYCDKWSQIKKGDIIRMWCVHHDSEYSNNVLRVKSDVELVYSINYYEEVTRINAKYDGFIEGDDLISHNMWLDIINFNFSKFNKKHSNKYVFSLFNLDNVELVKYINADKKTKYQFNIPRNLYNFYADIVTVNLNYDNRVGHYYSGFVLMQFAVKNNRIRAKIYDFLNEDNSFKKIYNPFDDDLPF